MPTESFKLAQRRYDAMNPPEFYAPEDVDAPEPYTYLEDVTAILQKHACNRLKECDVEISIHNTLTAMREAADNDYSHPDTPDNLREELEEIATALDVILAYVGRPSYAKHGVPYWPGWGGLMREDKS